MKRFIDLKDGDKYYYVCLNYPCVCEKSIVIDNCNTGKVISLPCNWLGKLFYHIYPEQKNILESDRFSIDLGYYAFTIKEEAHRLVDTLINDFKFK